MMFLLMHVCHQVLPFTPSRGALIINTCRSVLLILAKFAMFLAIFVALVHRLFVFLYWHHQKEFQCDAQ